MPGDVSNIIFDEQDAGSAPGMTTEDGNGDTEKAKGKPEC